MMTWYTLIPLSYLQNFPAWTTHWWYL
jgi:hypothetical protein